MPNINDNSKKPGSSSSTSKISSELGIWKSMEKYISSAGRWAWVWVLISAIIYALWLTWEIYAIISVYIAYDYALDSIYWTEFWRAWIWQIIYDGLFLICAVIFTFIYIIPRFSKPCKNMDWQFLADDGYNIGSFRIPKMLFFGILFTILGHGWGGALLLGPAISIILWAPVTINWHLKVKAEFCFNRIIISP